MKFYPVIKYTPSAMALLAVLFFSNCRQPASSDKNRESIAQLSGDTLPAYNIPAVDSLFLVNFIEENAIIKDYAPGLFEFYGKRNYECSWFNEYGLTEQAGKVVNLIRDYIAADIVDTSVFLPGVIELHDTITADTFTPEGNDSLVLRAEVLFTTQFLRFSEKAWKGLHEEKIRQLEWYLPVNRISQLDYLNNLLSPATTVIQGTEPVARQFLKLKEALKKYAAIENAGGWDTIRQITHVLNPGDSSEVIIALRKRLAASGDLSGDSTGMMFDDSLAAIVGAIRQSFGLSEDTVIDNALIRELNVPVQLRIRLMLINLERWKWIPAEPGANFIAVNIPEYMLHVFEDGKIIKDMKVIVGKSANQTVIFSGDLKYVVLSPYWVIPRSIVARETLPALKKNPGYLSRHNMEVVTNTSPPTVIAPSKINFNNYSGYNFPYVIRQKPGPSNSLGHVKFLFPNSYSIYLHDTPSRNLFGETNRGFSHGCIRIAEPAWLAKYLLRNDENWSDESIEEAMYAGKETYVTLKETLPVYITYFTSWVDKNGRLNFRKDIYGHDKRLEKELFQ